VHFWKSSKATIVKSLVAYFVVQDGMTMMTEAQWNKYRNLSAMFDELNPKTWYRKQRLFACACCRSIWDLLPDDASREAVRTAERFADGDVTSDGLRKAYEALVESGPTSRVWNPAAGAAELFTGSYHATASSFLRAATESVEACGAALVGPRSRRSPGRAERNENARQCDMLRDIAGPLLFRRIAVDRTWLFWNSGTVPKIAEAIYDDRLFDNMPILADALEEAGCTNAEILDHCRVGGEHVRGCWVVDLLLGKS
jgi:hypothetical protein